MFSFPRGATIAGVSVTTLKAILTSIKRTNSFRSAIQLQSVAVSQCDYAVAIEAAIHAGLVDPDGAALTPLGYAVLGASSKARLPRDTALGLLRSLLEAAERCNAACDRIYEIEEIWLFGSLMRGADTVGDINLVIRWVGRRGSTREERDQRTTARFWQLYPDAEWGEVWNMAEQLQDHDLFGKRRNSAYSVHAGIEMLIDMAEPCMKVFSLTDGIITAPVALDRHPKASTRKKLAGPRVTADDRDRLLALQPTPRPMPANWPCLTNGQWLPNARMFDLDPATSGFYHVARLSDHFHSGKQRNLLVFTHHDSHQLSERSLAALPGTFNGREAALIVTDHKNLVLQRGMDTGQYGTVIYNITLSDYGFGGKRSGALGAGEVAVYEDLIGYYLASLVYADTLSARTLDASIAMIHFFSAMPGNDAIEARMRYWANHLVKATPSASSAAA